MYKSTFAILPWIALLDTVYAGPAAEPQITPGPLVKRQNQNFVGYYASSVAAGLTTWGTITCKAGYTFTSAANFYKCCSIGAACNMYTGCSGSTILGIGTSADCQQLATGAFCSSDLLYPSQGALTAQSYVWCGTAGDSGTNIYRVTSAQVTSSGITTPIIRTTGTGSSTITSSTSTSSTVPPTPTPSKKPTPVGAIAGGVVGGLAVVGIAAAGILFLCLRKKRTNQNNPNGNNFAPIAGAGGAMVENKPAMTQYAAEVPQQNVYGQQNAYGVAPAPPFGQQQQQPQGGYYPYDNKAVGAGGYGVSPAGSPAPNNAYPTNPHDSMYKSPIIPQSPQPPTNTFELESPPINNIQPQNVQGAQHFPAQGQPQGPVELHAPMASPPPRYSNVGGQQQ